MVPFRQANPFSTQFSTSDRLSNLYEALRLKAVINISHCQIIYHFYLVKKYIVADCQIFYLLHLVKKYLVENISPNLFGMNEKKFFAWRYSFSIHLMIDY